MRSLLFGNWWSALKLDQQIFWSIAIVFSILSFILFLLNLIDFDQDMELEKAKSKKNNFVDARLTLVFLTSLGWLGVLFSGMDLSGKNTLIFAASGALLISLLQGLFFGFPWKKELDIKKLVASTGQVHQSIPPHRNGMGKVHLDIRRKVYEVDALTTGRALPEGVPVRVIDIVDEKIVVVEAIDKKSPNI